MRESRVYRSAASAGATMAGIAAAASALAILAAAPAAYAGNNIDTTSTANASFSSQGPGDTASYGQTITAPVSGDSALLNFSFFVSDTASSFQDDAEVFAWDPTTDSTTGSALFTSAPITIQQSSSFQQYQVNLGGSGLNLTPGDEYLLEFTSVAPYDPSSTALASFEANYQNDPYSGGQFIYTNNQGTSYLTTFGSSDLAFTANFGPTVTPEPGMLVTGASMLSMTGIGLIRGRRRAKRSNNAGAAKA